MRLGRSIHSLRPRMRAFRPAGAAASIAVLALTASPALAGDSAPPALQGLASQPSVGLLNSGLIDFSRFDLDHSLSYSFSSASGYRSQSAGLWTSRLGYRISDPLRISVGVGATMSPGGESLFNEKSFFLQNFSLDYRPSSKFRLNISYVNMPSEAAQALGYRAMPYHLSRRPWDSPLDPDR